MRPGLAVVLLLESAACSAPARHPVGSAPAIEAPPGAAPDERIAAAQAKLALHPRLDPVWAELGEAWLDRARTTRDPGDVRRARDALATSLGLQRNFVALRGMASLACFRHQFEEALPWCDEAEQAYAEDTSVAAMRVEALIALGRLDDAERSLAGRPVSSGEFHLRAARARVRLARGDASAAESLYLEAAAVAATRASPLQRWALVRAAAIHVDANEPDRARPLLLRALGLDLLDPDANAHMAEVEERSGDPRAALRRLEALLARHDDPVLHVAAARLARRTGDPEAASRHVVASETVLRAGIEASELYPLGPLARLLLDEGSRPEEALDLARRNAQALRTGEARALLEEAERALAASP